MSGAARITQADRARWQRQAAAELARILGAHPELPAIAWTVGPAGCVLAGRVNGLAPPGRVREVFGAWRAALALDGGPGAGVRRRDGVLARGGPPQRGQGPDHRHRLRGRGGPVSAPPGSRDAPARAGQPRDSCGLLEKLAAAVRPEFRAGRAGVRPG